jgi:hypothetical protein
MKHYGIQRFYSLLHILILFFVIAGCKKDNSGPVENSDTPRTGILIPDTGQTTSYTSTYGEDSDYIINPPSYTDNGDGTITDKTTGLMWQKTDGGEMSFTLAAGY